LRHYPASTAQAMRSSVFRFQRNNFRGFEPRDCEAVLLSD
jgi:hypothetical protein